MKAICSVFLVALTTTFVYEAIDARPQFDGFPGADMFGNLGEGIKNTVSSWLFSHAPGKAGNEGEFRLPSNGGQQPMAPVGSSGLLNNRQLTGYGQQAFGPGPRGMLPNNQFRGPQQPGMYKGPALNRAGRR